MKSKNRCVSQKQGTLRELRVVWYLVEADKKIDLELWGGGTVNHICEI